jgi:sulfite reductase alpha subunit-like flavoprotein
LTVAYSVLALGDTNYDKFCESGKLIDKKLGDWGATPACGGVGVGVGGVGEMEVKCEEDVIVGVESIPAATARISVDTSASTSRSSEAFSNVNGLVSHTEKKKVSATDDHRQNVALDVGNTPRINDDTDSELVAATATATTTPVKSPSPLYILYGSATGNAEHIAKDLASTYESHLNNPSSSSFNNYYFPSVICCKLNHYKRKCLDVWTERPHPTNDAVKHGVLIVCSTTGMPMHPRMPIGLSVR